MTIYNGNTNPSDLKLDDTLRHLGMTLQSLNNHLGSLKEPKKTLSTPDRVLARRDYAKSHGDAMLGELALNGFSAIAGLDVLDSINEMSGGFGEALMEAAQDLHELEGRNNMTALEKALRLRRRRAYEDELRFERKSERESQKLKNMMTLMAMAVATLEERVKRREKREIKTKAIKAFAQNNKSIALKKKQAKLGINNVISMNSQDIVMEAA